jgi:hypothetical protein
MSHVTIFPLHQGPLTASLLEYEGQLMNTMAVRNFKLMLAFAGDHPTRIPPLLLAHDLIITGTLSFVSFVSTDCRRCILTSSEIVAFDLSEMYITVPRACTYVCVMAVLNPSVLATYLAPCAYRNQARGYPR